VNNKLTIKENPWPAVKSDPISINEFNNKLNAAVHTGREEDLKISLSLSGGLDSRVLLAQLLNSRNIEFDCHTIMSASGTDGKIARRITKDLNIEHIMLTGKSQHTYIIDDLKEYIGLTYLTDSAFTSRKLMYYKFMPKNSLIIDGGFGEIWRREFLNKLYYFGMNDIQNRNYENIAGYLMNKKADIFNDDCYSAMKNGINDQLDYLFSMLPGINSIGLENWLDIFSLKTRLVNFYAPEQGRIDNYVTAYMPFVQPNLIENLLNVPIELRKNNRLFKGLIKLNYPALSKFPLAKGNLIYPFWFSPLLKRAYFKIRERKAEPFEIILFLAEIKEFILDTTYSNSVKECPYYNYTEIENRVAAYYKGNSRDSQFVDWFISFEIFRQLLED
jgi:hypothetical protein